MEYNDLLNEFLDLLDKDKDIRRLKKLKQELLKDKSLQEDLEKYHLTRSLLDKQKLYQNSNYKEYLELETKINLLIFSIKDQFKIFNIRKCHHESH